MPGQAREMTEPGFSPNARRADRRAYSEFAPDVARYNLHSLSQVSLAGLAISVALLVLSLLPLGMFKLSWGYAGIAALFAALTGLAHGVLPKHYGLVLPTVYAATAVLLSIGIAMGTIWGRQTNAVTFMALILVLPLFVIDRPLRLHAAFGIACVAFCLATYNVKDWDVAKMDFANCATYYVISVAISRQSIRTKVSDIVIKGELKKQRDIDVLTRLGNRGVFERRVNQYIHESNLDAIMLIMDLDNFKSVNDLMGHGCGDEVLRRAGACLASCFRGGDIVGRLGGDEFVAFLPAVGGVDNIGPNVKRLIESVDRIGRDMGLPCKLGTSVGLARYPDDGCSFQELYRRADAALYFAKRNGKGACAVYDEGMSDD